MHRLVAQLREHLRRYGFRASGLVISGAVSMVGVGIGTRVLTGIVDPSTFGEFKLISGLGLLLAGVLFRPLVQYVMRAYHDADEIGDADGFVADGRR